MRQIRNSGIEPLSQTGSLDEKYGEYSEEKYAFMVKVLRTSYQYFSWIPGSNWAYDGGVTDLINALNAYNAEHPDAPKDFTFPGM